MEQPLVSFEVKENYLLVVGHGRRESLTEMVAASKQIADKIKETGIRYLLIDYRKLDIHVRINEAFNIVREYEAHQPGLREVIIAAVFEERGWAFANYWKEIGKQRGFTITLFNDITIAEAWLQDQIHK